MSEMKDNVIHLRQSPPANPNAKLPQARLSEDSVHAVAKEAAKCAKKVYRQTSAAIFFSPWRQKSRFS